MRQCIVHLKDNIGYTLETPLLSPEPVRLAVLDTDYETFASVYFCYTILGRFKIENGFLFTRETEPSDEVVRCQKIP